MRFPKRLVSVPLNPVLRRLRDIAAKTAGHKVLLVRMTPTNFGMHVIQRRRTPQIRITVGALIAPMIKD